MIDKRMSDDTKKRLNKENQLLIKAEVAKTKAQKQKESEAAEWSQTKHSQEQASLSEKTPELSRTAVSTISIFRCSTFMFFW